MTPEQALKLLDGIVSVVKMERQHHQAVTAAVGILGAVVRDWNSHQAGVGNSKPTNRVVEMGITPTGSPTFKEAVEKALPERPMASTGSPIPNTSKEKDFLEAPPERLGNES